jgi:Tc toxin complex TcA C-terminal TcB-binding domain
MVTSSGNNDSGMFETNLREERLLPFEGAGAESTWKLELPASFRQFDYSTISDVILHIRYTARQGGSQLQNKATEHLQEFLARANASGLALVFSLPHDFPGEWHRFVAGTADFTATVKRDHFPYFTLGTDIALTAVQYAQDDKLEFVTPQGLDLPALTTKLNTDGAFEMSLAPDAVLVNDQANVVLLITYSVGSI